MAKYIMQFRYYGEDGKENNYPPNISKEMLYNGANSGIFADYLPITKLGIQTLPGSRVYLNNDTPIVIGSTGIYDLDLEGISEINKIYFDRTSIDAIDKNSNAFLIVDIVYDKVK